MVEIDEAPEREGSDITAADMLPSPEEPSEIVEFYKNSIIFLTGATGFLGKMALEKLLRTCTEIQKIYILIRPKKGKDTQKRLEEIFEGPSFEPLKRKNPNFAHKVEVIEGDCALTDLGLSELNLKKIITEVDCIIHCAATVRFDEKLRIATNINVKSVKDLIKIAKQMKHLRAFIYVSTAFSNCIRKKIDETFYEPPISGDKLLTLCQILKDDKLDAFTPILLGEYPNTYVFTKAVAESVVREEGKNLPIAVFRPSIVIASVKEPVAGWIDNFYGATGVLMGAALGLLRSLHGRKENIAEMVPADYVINCALASGWDIATIKSINNNKETTTKNYNNNDRDEKFLNDVPVYNFVSSPDKIITWDMFKKLSEKHATQVPTPLLVWQYFFDLRSNYYHHKLATFFYQTVPAYIVDFILICIGKKPMLVKGYQKIDKFANVISYFSLREWYFKNNNVKTLWNKMNKKDRELFEFSMKDFNWDSYFYTYVRGARAYLLKDPLDTLPQGKVKYYKLMVAHYTLVVFLFLAFIKLFLIFFNYIF